MLQYGWKNYWIFFFLVLIGSGCVSVEPQKMTNEEAALSLSFSSGMKFTERETVLGLGGKFVTFFEQEDAERTITIDQWSAGQSAKLNWERTHKTETDISKKARQEYYARYAAAPIGSELPNAPDPVFESTTEQGALSTTALSTAEKTLLPVFWKAEKTDSEDSSLIWISKKQYDELIQTRRTNINLGLFDDSVSYAIGLTDQVKNFVEKLKGSPEPTEEKNILEVRADIEWGSYTLSIDGVPTTVRTIQAQNAFARYTILANPENPLILELMLSPASRGSLNLFSRKAFAQAFWGYEITSVTRNTPL